MPSPTTIAKLRTTCAEADDARYREECIFASCMSAVDIIAALGTSGATDRKDPDASGTRTRLIRWTRWTRSFFSPQPRKRFVVLKASAKKARRWTGARDEVVVRA